MQVTPPPITRAEAQVALVHRMLTEHGRDRANELFLVNGAMYRIHVERVLPEDMPAAALESIEEARHANQSMGAPQRRD